jgi:hypothetical protein|tara:strand:- start:2797 stop:3912 length:1116 start_codon:yes stop_codon:yes gene_type:complete
MANKFTRFLTDVFTGLSNPKGRVANYTHATRLFIDDNMRLSPKHKYNYYVRVELDSSAHKAPNFTAKHAEEVGLLVKNINLPSFKFDTEVLNQYNRKKIIYKMINYDPVQFTFHDDNQGVVNALWALYYGYYVADRNLPNAAYDFNHYRVTDTNMDQYRYGLDNNITTPLFKSVQIYTMGRRRFIGYELINPRITSWQHGDYDYMAGSEPAESTMQLQYEGVRYSAGTVSEGSPKGFATLHYDTTPGPLQMGGGGVSNLLGGGGVLDGLESVFGAVGDGSAFSSPQGFLSTAVSAINTYKNAKGLSKDSILQEGINILTSPAGQQTVANTINGVVGAVFPKNRNTTGETKATPKKVIGNTGEGRQDRFDRA